MTDKENEKEKVQEERTEDASDSQDVKDEKTVEESLAEMSDKYVRLYSDFDNFRKRTIKEKADLISTASASVLKDLLTVLDDFERAVSNNEKVDDLDHLREGFKLIHHKMIGVLESKGLESMNAKGEVFDADKHEAITNIPVQDDADKGKVVDVIERGYSLKGKPLRYAKVVVGQ